ncbi:hypothetical protein E0H70_25020, partial [Rhizobium leguminosarum bv. viciae]
MVIKTPLSPRRFCFYAIPDGKPLHTFPGIALGGAATLMHGRGSAFATDPEAADKIDQLVGIAGQRFGRCRGLFGHGG